MKSNIYLALAMLFISAVLMNLAAAQASTSVSLVANSAFDAGQTILFNVSISGGTGSYTVQIYNVTSGAPLGGTFPVSSGSSGTMSITAGSTGSFQYNAVATNASSATFASNTKGITVSSALGTPSAPTASNATLDIGQSQTLSVPAVSGGTSPVMYNFTVSYSSNNVATRSSGPQTSNSYTFSPSVVGTVHSNVTVTDGASLPAKIASSYGSTDTRYATPTATLTPNSSSISSGGSVVYNVLISNGQGPFTVNLVSSNGMVVQSVTGASQGVTTFSAFAPPSGSDSFNVVAADSTSTPFVFASSSNTIAVGSLGSGSPLTLNSFCFSGSLCTGIKADAGQTLQLTASVSGGTGPYSYNYIIYNSTGVAVVSAVRSNSTSDSYSFSIPSSAGSGSFRANLTVTDSASRSVKATPLTLTVNSIPSVTTTPSNAVLYTGYAEIYSTKLTGGTGPFNVKLEYASNSTTVANTSKTGVSAGTVNMVFTPKLGTTSYLAVATDTGTTNPYVYASATNTTKVVNAPTVSISVNSTSVNTTVLFNVSVPALVGAGPFQIGIRKGTSNLTVHTIPAGGGSFTFRYVSGTAGSISFKAVALDQGISPNYFFGSSNVTVSFGSAGATTTTTTSTTTTVSSGTGSSTASSTTIAKSTTSTGASTTGSSSSSTTATTTTILNTKKVTQASSNVTLNVTSSAPAAVNFTNTGTLIELFSNSTSKANVILAISNNTASSPALANYTKLFTMLTNATTTASGTNITVKLISKYPCALNASRVVPYKLYANGTWVKIPNALVNKVTCTLEFTVPKDPTVGLFLAPAPASTSIPLPTVNPTLDVYGVVIAIVVVVVIIVIAALYFKRKTPARSQRP